MARFVRMRSLYKPTEAVHVNPDAVAYMKEERAGQYRGTALWMVGGDANLGPALYVQGTPEEVADRLSDGHVPLPCSTPEERGGDYA